MITKTALSRMVKYVCTAFAVVFSFCAYAGKETARNPPECDKTSEDCGCDTGEEVGNVGGSHREPGQTYQECVKEAATRSMKEDSSCKANAGDIVNSVFRRCFGGALP